MPSPEDRSWRSRPDPSEPTKEMIEAGVRTMREKGRLYLPAGVPKRWLEVTVREVWKVMERSAGRLH